MTLRIGRFRITIRFSAVAGCAAKSGRRIARAQEQDKHECLPHLLLGPGGDYKQAVRLDAPYACGLESEAYCVGSML